MTTILHLDSSVRAISNSNPDHNSISKNIANEFINSWQKSKNIDEYIYRDLGVNPPEFITQQWIGAVFTAENKRSAQQRRILALSDTLLDELYRADIILISTPMYNYGMPAQLKAWFDQVIRINKTFDFDLARGDTPLKPLLSGKTVVLITSCGEFGFEAGGINEKHSHLSPHIRTLSKYLGVTKMFEIASEYQEFNDERHHNSMSKAYIDAHTLALTLSKKEV
ncbi:FMN-dependent NADH-azoreductase [Pseudoalteromonas sp. SSM20]|uniref:FMN-dependent NADH-azoreductase n=1 Tax=Pseudoalteromonas sp. SSM20 TaxID=3139394 RepID=UPI003BADA0DF